MIVLTFHCKIISRSCLTEVKTHEERQPCTDGIASFILIIKKAELHTLFMQYLHTGTCAPM